jgi:hypothetical protein
MNLFVVFQEFQEFPAEEAKEFQCMYNVKNIGENERFHKLHVYIKTSPYYFWPQAMV